jgi:hypothetical protein
MTLATSVHITSPINPELVFLKARQIIGIPAEHPFKILEDSGLGWDNGIWIASTPGGFRSALDVSHNNGELLKADCDEWCEKPCEYHRDLPLAYVDVRLDTTYGYGEDGMSCSDVHREITAKLGAWLDEQGIGWWAQDEFTGIWYERTPCPVSG